MTAVTPIWPELSTEERHKLMLVAAVYSKPDDAGPEEIASEMFYAVQEVLRDRGAAKPTGGTSKTEMYKLFTELRKARQSVLMSADGIEDAITSLWPEMYQEPPEVDPRRNAEQLSEEMSKAVAIAPWGSRWKHLKTGNIYVVTGHCFLEATAAPAIIYTLEGKNGDQVWARDAGEFIDGRFLRQPYQPTKGA